MKLTLYSLMAILLALFTFNSSAVFAQPSNNTCSYAQTLPVGAYGNCSPVAGSTLNATQNIPGCVGNADDDVWYQFTATSTSMQISVTGDSNFDAVLQVFSGGCAVLNNMGCIDNTSWGGTETFSSASFVVGQVYRVRVYHYFAGSGSGNFNICVTQGASAPANDFCGGAINLPISTSCNYQTFNNYSATESFVGCAGNADDDVWFSFTATNAVHEIRVNPNGSLMDPVVELYSGSCTSLSSMICMDDTWFDDEEIIQAVGLIPGQTYYFRVYDYYSNWDATFDVCVTGAATSAPTNDEPCDAIELPTVSSACDYLRFSNVGATQSTGAGIPFPTHSPSDPSCESGSGTGFNINAGDVWFKVKVPASGTVNIQMEPNLGAGGIVTDGAMALYTGNCGNLTQIAYSNDYSCYPPSVTNPISTLMPFISQSGLTPGSEVYIRFWNWSNSSKGEFGLCVTDAVNDDCADALYICDINGYKGTTGAFYTADRPDNMRGNTETNDPPTYTYTPGTDQGGIFGHWWDPPSHPYRSPNLDVQIDNNSWIRFTASASTAVLNVDVYDCYRERGIQMQIFSSDGCSNFYPTSEFKEDANQFTLTATNLTIGDDYLLMIDGFAGDICSYTITAESGVQFPDIEPVVPEICMGDAVILAAPAGATSYEWLHSGENTQAVSVNPSTTTTYSVVVEGLCNYKQTLSAVVTIKPSPIIEFSTGENVTICQGESVTITGSGANTYSWSHGLGTGPTKTVSPNTTTTYTVTGVIDGCVGDKSVTVNVTPKPSTPTASAAQNFCGSARVSDLTASGSGVQWYTSNSGGSPLSGSTTLSNGGVYYASQTTNGCESDRTPVTVSIDTPVNAGTISGGTSVCSGGTINLSTTGTGGTWSSSNTSVATVSNTGVVTSHNNGTTIISYTVPANGTCPGDNATHSITISPTPAAPTAANQNFCGSATVNSLTASGSNIQWYSNSSGGSPLSSSTPLTNGGTYYASQTTGSCESSRTPITVTLDAPVNAGTISGGNSICDGGTINLSTTGSGGTWSSSNTSVATVNNGVVTSHSGGTAVISYSVPANGACPGDIATHTITISPTPNAPTAANQDFCGSATVNSLTASGSNIQWYSNSSGGSPLSSSTPLTNGGTYYASQTTGSCESSRTPITVTLDTPVNAGTISGGNSICDGGTINLSTTGTGGTWSSSNSSVATVNNGVVTSHSDGTAVISYSVPANGACPGDIATHTITISPTPAAPTASNQHFCASTNPTVASLVPNGANINWYDNSNNLLNGTDALVNGNNYYASAVLNGCESSTVSIEVEITSTPLVNPSSTVTDLCEGNTINLVGGMVVGQFDTDYYWEDPDGNQLANNTTISDATPAHSGTYVLIGEKNGCTGSQNVNITVNALPTVNLAASDPTICDGESVTLTASGTAGVTYTWDNGLANGDSHTVTPNSTTTYTVTAIDGNSCENEANTTVNVNPLPTVSIANSAAPANCGDDGTITLNFTDVADGNYTVHYNGGTFTNVTVSGGTATINTPAGTYNDIYIENTNGCVSTENPGIALVDPDSPTANATVTDNDLCVGDVIQLNANTIAGATYSWTGPDGFTSNDQNPIINNASTVNGGSYNLTITENGCHGTDAVSVTVNALPTVNLAASNPTICEGESVTLTASGTAGVTYTWDNGLANGASHTVSPNSTTTYTVTAIDGNSCEEEATTTVNVNPLPTVSLANSADPANCGDNGTITLNFTDVADGNYTVHYNGGSFTNVTVSGGSATINAPAGTYNDIYIENTNGCASTENPGVALADPDSPTANATVVSNAICAGDAIQLNANTIAGATYSWTGPNGFTSNDQNPVINNASTINGGSYNLTITENGCDGTDAVSVTVNALPSVNLAASDPTICEGESVTLTASGTAGVTYTWDNGLANGASHTVSPNSTTTYTVTAIDGNSCEEEATTTVNVNPLPTVSLANSADPANCGDNGTITLNFTDVDDGTYTVYYNNGSSFTNVSVSGGSATINAPAGTYNDIYIENSNGCASTENPGVALADPDAPTVDAGVDVEVCDGEEVTLSATTGAGVNISWDNGVTDGNPFTQTVGTTTYTVTAELDNCFSTDEVEVTVNALPNVSMSAIADLCEDNDAVTLVASPIDGIFSGPGVLNGEFNPSDAGVGIHEIKYIYTDGNTCTDSTTINITVKELASFSLDYTNPATCGGDEGTITISGLTPGEDYEVGYNNENAVSMTADANGDIIITGLSQGSYTDFEVTLDGCPAYDNTNFTLVDPNAPDIDVGADLEACHGEEVTLTAITDAGVNITWDNGISDGVPFTQDVGTTTYTVTAELNDCVSTAEIDVTINPLPTATIEIEGAMEICEDDQDAVIILSGSDSFAPYTFTYEDAQGNEQTITSDLSGEATINVSTNVPGTYTYDLISIEDDGTTTCSNAQSGSVTIVIKPLPEFEVGAVEDEVCISSNIMLTADDVENGEYYWEGPNGFSSNDQNPRVTDVTLDAEGEYFLTVELDGCVVEKSIYITVKACEIIIGEVVTPNNDGDNDTWIIENIESFPNTEVWIYDRWGLEVYHSDDYKNDWAGYSESSLNIGKGKLPEATYYYLIKLGGDGPNQGDIYKGYLYLKWDY